MTAMVLLSTWMESQVEFWLPTIFEGYDVSSFGRVRSWRQVGRQRDGKGWKGVRRDSPKLMSPHIHKGSYPVIRLGRSADGCKGKQVLVHRLVALTFIPNPDNLPTVNHLTGLKTDARVDGLAWASRSEQSKHAWANGLHKRDKYAIAKKMVDARKGYRDIPDIMIHMIRAMLSDGISQGQIRRWSGLKWITIQSIAVGRTYKDVA